MAKAAAPIEIIDAHHHLWDLDPDGSGIPYGWQRDVGAMRPFGDPAPIQRSYLIDELKGESKIARITGSVHVQCDSALENPVEETRWLQSVAMRSGGMPNAIVGLVDLSRSGAQDTLFAHTKYKNFRGVRQIVAQLDNRPDLSFRDDHLLRNAMWRDQFGLLEEYDLSFDLQLYPEQMADAAELLAQHTRIPVVIDHAGSPYDQSPEGLRAWRRGLELLASLPHVFIKISGFGMYDAQWSAESIEPIYGSIMEMFGPQRAMFGSNFPVDKLMTEYDYILTEVLKLAAGHSAADKAALFGGTARDFYRF